MVRDDQYVSVPSFFKCPISLDVMKSPVSLTTGVTYDRDSIKRWLDAGNDTCPATMQVLQSKDFVPNLTLQRLIQIWYDSPPKKVSDLRNVVSRNQVSDLLRCESLFSVDSLSKISRFARESGENRRFLAAETSGFVAAGVEFLCGGGRVDVVEMVVRVLDVVRLEIGDEAKVKLGRGECLRSFVLVLQKGSVESRIGVARVLEAIAVDVESKVRVSENEDLVSELVKMMSSEKDASLIEAGVSCLAAVLPPRRARARIVRLGAIQSVKRFLSKPNQSGAAVEKALRILETAATVREGREEIAGDGELIERVVGRLLKGSPAATEHAAAVLWSVCCLQGNAAAREAATAANGAAKVLLVMQTDCSPAVRQMAAELLRAFRLCTSKSASSFVSCCYDTKTTHIMPF